MSCMPGQLSCLDLTFPAVHGWLRFYQRVPEYSKKGLPTFSSIPVHLGEGSLRNVMNLTGEVENESS